MKEKETNDNIVIEIGSEEVKTKTKSNRFEVLNPLKDLNLGDQAYKVNKLDVSDTEPDLKGFDIAYYTVTGGEIESKGWNKKRDGVVFNKDLPGQFEIPVEPEELTLVDAVDRWYSDQNQALGIAKALTQAELKRVKGTLGKWEKTAKFLEDQLDRNMY